MSTQPPQKLPRDPFRLLALLGIVIGLLIVTAACVFWALTGRESTLIVGAGMALATGSGLANRAATMLGLLPNYAPPPPEIPPSHHPTTTTTTRRDVR